jgi:predicted DNA-binding protein YlxM (UPF0122 family)
MDVNELKEEIKKLKAQRTSLNKKIKRTTELLHHYQDRTEHIQRYISTYERMLPKKFYKITYSLKKFGNEDPVTFTELKQAVHPEIITTDLMIENINTHVFKLIDILEVAS